MAVNKVTYSNDQLDRMLVKLLKLAEQREVGGCGNLSNWAATSGIVLDGRPFSFERHEYLKEPYGDTHPDQTEMKATQLGLTSKAMLRAMYGARYGAYKGILYLFPSKSDVLDFSKGRISPLIEDNPDTIGKWVQDTNSAGVKKIWQTFLYLRGMKSRVGLKCHDDETEVLVRGGWKLFKDVVMDDWIATRAPTGEFMWQKPTAIHEYATSYFYNGIGELLPNAEEIYYFKANGLDFAVTGDHRLLLTSQNDPKQREWIDTTVNILPNLNKNLSVVRTSKGWKGEIPEFISREHRWDDGLFSFVVPGKYNNYRWLHLGRENERLIRLTDWCAFLGLYAAEGSCSGISTGVQKNGRVSISQVETSTHIDDIRMLLNRLPFDFRYSGHNFRVSDMELAKVLFPMGDKYTKCLPDWVLELPTKYLEIVWEWAVKGDGHVSDNGYRNYATVSKKLADQFQELLQKCGRSASILIQAPSKTPSKDKTGREYKQTTPLYLVSERKSRCSVIPEPEIIPYDRNVYCVSVPNGVIYTRRNGYAMWSGNSVPIDFIIYDELDEAPQKAVDMAQERMAHSEIRETLKLSNPTIPDYGIDKAFQETDQKYWLLKCPACGHYTCLEDTFPGCLVETTDGRVIRGCEKCQAELDCAQGEWVAKRPGADKRGYHYSQLFSTYVRPGDILHQFRTTNNLQDFYNLKIGIAWIEAENRLAVEEVLHLCGSEGIRQMDLGPCSMGVDQGKDLHVVIGRKGHDRLDQIVHLGVYRDWEELDRLMHNFNIQRCVVDALPETRNARAFAERFGGRVFLNYYQEHQKGSYRWNEKDLTVACNRTESLDASHNQILFRKLYLPRQSDLVELFAKHLNNVAKKLEEDEESGSKRYVYVKLGPDHFRHAFNYEVMAREFIGEPDDGEEEMYFRERTMSSGASGRNPVTGY